MRQIWNSCTCNTNEKRATDVTEFKVPETGRKLYLSVIIDLYDRFPVAYVISGRNNNKLVFDTYDKIIGRKEELKAVGKALQEHNPVFITGTAGMGKSDW